MPVPPDLADRCDTLLKQFPADQALNTADHADRLQPGAIRNAAILTQWGATEEMICAALLEPLVASGRLQYADVEKTLGPDIARLTDEICALENQRASSPAHARRETRFSQALSALFVAAYHDPRLAILAAADYWNRCGPNDESPATRGHEHLAEAQYVLLPLLGMLGMWDRRRALEIWLVSQLQDDESSRNIWDIPEHTERTFQAISLEIAQSLALAMPDARLRRRQQPGARGDQRIGALDRLSLDLLVADEADCYSALYMIHRQWRPAEGAIHDYIGASKINGYRCLRTSVIVPHGAGTVRVSFHIQTRQMDEINNWGIAAICMREQLDASLPQAWWNQREDTYTRLNTAALGSLPDTLCVFSPQGQVFEFQRGATVVDYAYQVHSEVANQCVRFRINNEVVNPTTVLHHLDLIELEQEVGAPGPTRAWLGAARTSRARFHIERFLKRRGSSSDAGQRTLDSRLDALETHYGFRLPKHRVEQALIQYARRTTMTTPEMLLAGFANGSITPDKLLHPLFSDEIVRQVELPSSLKLFPRQIRLGQCCRPRLGEDIHGRLRFRGSEVCGITVHRDDCKTPERRDQALPLRWRWSPQLNTFAELDIIAVDEPELLGHALQPVYERHPDVTLREVSATSHRGTAHVSFTIEAASEEAISQIVNDLESLPGHRIEAVRSMKPSFYVLERLNRSDAPLVHNPYSRQPVQEREMLFGRVDDLAQISASLHGLNNIVYLRGRKRVGKTSILWHLRDFYLERNLFLPCYIDLQLFGSLANGGILYNMAHTISRDLQREGHLGEIAAPVRELFEESPADQFTSYLHYIETFCAPRRLVLLIDEFSVAMDAYHSGALPADFFYHWRGILQSTHLNVAYVMVVQQRAYEAVLQSPLGQEKDPSWEALELGTSLLLKPLSDKDIRSLIERPTRNYLTYSPEALDRVVLLTGPSPFIVQVYCHAMVQRMANLSRRDVTMDDVESVAQQFMDYNETLFDHAVLGAGRHAFAICAAIASLSGAANRPVALAELVPLVSGADEADVRRTLQSLCEQGSLSESTPGAWRFASLLFRDWIKCNAPDVLMRKDATND